MTFTTLGSQTRIYKQICSPKPLKGPPQFLETAIYHIPYNTYHRLHSTVVPFDVEFPETAIFGQGRKPEEVLSGRLSTGQLDQRSLVWLSRVCYFGCLKGI